MVEEKDQEFEELLIETRHNELLNTLKTVVTLLSEKKDDGIAIALEKHTAAINSFASAIKSLPKPQVNINQGEIVSSVEQMGANIILALSELKQAIEDKPIVHEFRLEEDSISRSRVVKVVYKSTKEISAKAIKYGIN